MVQDTKIKKVLSKPRYLLFLIILSLFAAEWFLMIILHAVPLSVWHEIFLDPILLTMITFPLLYYYMFRPMQKHMEERKKEEEQQKVLISELQEALDKVKVLSGLLPTCAGCKKIKDCEGNWVTMEKFFSDHTEASFTHSFCDDCIKKLYPEEYKKMGLRK